jgi:hypothetical protein
MEAVIFEFTPPPSTHICPCPPDIILTNDSDKHTNCNPGKTSLSNNTPKTLILKQICTNSLTDLVLRIPKTNPNHFSTFIQNGDNSFELGGNQKQPRSPIHEYFHFKHHVLHTILPQQLIPHEIPLIITTQFVAMLFLSIASIRPRKRQDEYPIVSVVHNWTEGSPDKHLSNSQCYTQCLLMQDFTKHRLLHRLALQNDAKSSQFGKNVGSGVGNTHIDGHNTSNPVELDDVDTSLTHNHTQLTITDHHGEDQLFHKKPDELNLNNSNQINKVDFPHSTHHINFWGNITIGYELKPKWGYVRRSSCFPFKDMDKYISRLYPQGANLVNFLNKFPNLSPKQIDKLIPILFYTFQKVIFFFICRTCALRVHRGIVSKQKLEALNRTTVAQTDQTNATPSSQESQKTAEKIVKSTQKNENAVFCPLDLFSISNWAWTCPHDAQNHPKRCGKCITHNKTITNRLKTALLSLFQTRSPNLVCSLHIIPPNTPIDPQQIHPNESSTREELNLPIKLDTVLENILLTPTLTNFFKHLQISQFLLDPEGPNYKVYKGCTCKEIPICPQTGVKLFKDQGTPPVQQWTQCVKDCFDPNAISHLKLTPPRKLKDCIGISCPCSDPSKVTKGNIMCYGRRGDRNKTNKGGGEKSENNNLTPLIIPQLHSTCSSIVDILTPDEIIPNTEILLSQLVAEKSENQNVQIDDESINKNQSDNNNPTSPCIDQISEIGRGKLCQSCISRVCLTTSMTIKDLSFYISVTPVNISPNTQYQSQEMSNPSEQQFISLFDHEIPLLPLTATKSDTQLPHNVLQISQLGYFLFPIQSNEAGQTAELLTSDDLSSSNRILNGDNLSHQAIPLQFDLKTNISPLTSSDYNGLHSVLPLLPLDLINAPTIGQEKVVDNKYNYYLCRLQCGDIGPKKYSKYKAYIKQEADIIRSCFDSIFLNK